MSKSTIGGVIGAVIGFYVSGFNPYGAQVGFMIGAGIGASFDTIQGRKVGEMSSPRAQEGEPIPLVFGTARVTGRLMSCGEPSIVEEGGKGGPQVVNETAYLSYSILICESSELRNSLVAGVIMVIQNNKIVYDVTPESVVSPADNAKWLAGVLAPSRAKFILLMSHYPAWSSGRHGKAGADGKPAEKTVRQMQETVMPLLERCRATAKIGRAHV